MLCSSKALSDVKVFLIIAAIQIKVMNKRNSGTRILI